MDYRLSFDGTTLLYVDDDVEHLVLPDSVTIIKTGAFFRHKNIISLKAQNVEEIGELSFCNSSIENIDIPNCKIINSEAFRICKKLKTVNIPNVSLISPFTFDYCISLEYLEAPKLLKMDRYALKQNTSLKYIKAPMLSEAGELSLSGCDNLVIIDSKLSKDDLIIAFGYKYVNNMKAYDHYLQRNRDYKLSKLI